MSDAQPAGDGAVNASKSNKKLIRTILIGLLLLAVAVKVFDMNARARAQKTYDTINQKLEGDQSISDEDVHNMLGQPSKGYSPEPRKWIDEYSHRGAFYDYAVLVEYSDPAMKLVEGVN